MPVATVPFRGARSTSDVLTWGQRAIWTAIGRTRPSDAYFNFARTVDVRHTGAGLDAVLAAVALVMGRHEALRTRVSVVDGEPFQVVSSAGELPVDVVTEAPERLTERYLAAAFDYEHEWPLRVGVVVEDGRPAYVVVCFCHLATDFGGSVFVLRDLRAAVEGAELPEPAARQPVDLAAFQRSPAGRRMARAAANYWRRAYDRIPTSMFEHRAATHENPRYQRAFLLSPALAVAATAVGDRLGTGSSAVLNAAFAAVIGSLTGHDTCAMLAITQNRFGERTRDMVATLALEGLLVVSLADAVSFDDMVRRAWRAAVPAHRYAQYDERDRDRIVRETSERRGAFVHPYCCVNDLREAELPPITGGAAPRDLLGESTLAWLPPLDHVSCRFCLHVGGAENTLGIRLTADTAYVPKTDMTAFLTGVERLVVAAVDGQVDLPAGSIRA
ncbi:MAG TPA: condensation domain-containing protein [Pseudonocardiaceae bacterium]|nr:condensation domain-containing protein [Pseudonocardiaceae bacterium]